MKVEGAIALVTGAGSGIGRCTALVLTARRSLVVVVDVDGDAAEKVAAACGEAGGDAVAFACDVADPDAVSGLAAEVHERYGPLDLLVNNAGVGVSGPFADTTLDDWRWIRSVNLDGAFHTCSAFGPPMIERGEGQVVNVSSGLAFTPTANESAYVTTKAGLLALSLSLRADWAGAGVGVSVVCPGFIDTPIVDHARFVGDADTPERKERARRLFRRGHPPEKVARAIVRAAQRNRPLVNVGAEAKVGWMFHRLGPVWAQQHLARRLGKV